MKPTDKKNTGAGASTHHSPKRRSTATRVIAVGLAVLMVLGIVVMAIQSASL